MNFYNEIDPYCCDWLENLIREKLIPDGIVDRRSIVDIVPHELARFTQCHFFAELGGWPLALRRAGLAQRERFAGVQREALGAFAREDFANAGHPFDLANGNGQRQPERPQQHQRAKQSEFEASCGDDAMRCNMDWVIGADGKARRAKSGIRLLAHGVPNRVAKLRAFGNAIDPRPAAAFIRSMMKMLDSPPQP